MHNLFIKLLPVLFFTFFAHSVQAGTAIIANTANPDASISKKLAKKLFMGKKSNTGNMDVLPVDQDDGSDIRTTFYKKVANKSPDKMKNYWSKLIFSGRAIPLKVISGDAAVIDWVAKNKNAIGYVDSSSVNSSVKLILELP